MTFDPKRDVKRVLAILFAALLLSISIKTFVRAADLFPGGVTGLTVLTQRLCEKYLHFIPDYTPINLAFNAFPVYIGFRYVGKKFTLLSLLLIVVSGVLTDMLPSYIITYDPLLISVFGGILSGTAVSICLLADATSGGTDFIAIYLSQKRGVETWNLVLGFNVIILAVAGFFFGWERALYSIIYQFVSTQTLHTLYRSYQKQTLFIVTDKAEEVCQAIHDACNHGATVYDVEGSYSHRNLKMVYSIISGSDVNPTLTAIHDVDPDAFVNSIRTSEIRGHFYMKPKD